MPFVFLICLFFSATTFAQYDDYQSYQTFTDLDRDQIDFGLVFVPSFGYLSINEQNDVPGDTVIDRKRDVLLYDLRMGYVFRGGFYFGILVTGESHEVNTRAPKADRQGVGLSLGFLKNGWNVTGHFFPYSKQELVGTGDTISEYSNGTGFQLDAAYYFRISRYVSVGPQLVYKSFQYGEAENSVTNNDSSAGSTHTVLSPMLSFMFNLYRG